ncbi:hypothetical protein [Nocardia vulneris]|uniref:hypothetical protein n=1 Tax=Nocardia vulneris TaxID=1141657 RepID=UPI000A7BAB4E|nr:hypothetical protein [Nocardia vulneris]
MTFDRVEMVELGGLDVTTTTQSMPPVTTVAPTDVVIGVAVRECTLPPLYLAHADILARSADPDDPARTDWG